MKIILTAFIFFIALFVSAQNAEPNWTRVDFDYSSRMYIDVNSIQNVGDTLYSVWTMEENFPPLSIESVNGKIYTTKTFYTFSRTEKRYSFFEIIYYDEKNNVLNSFSYRRNTENQTYQFNYPIIDGSIEYSILMKCVKLTEGTE